LLWFTSFWYKSPFHKGNYDFTTFPGQLQAFFEENSGTGIFGV